MSRGMCPAVAWCVCGQRAAGRATHLPLQFLRFLQICGLLFRRLARPVKVLNAHLAIGSEGVGIGRVAVHCLILLLVPVPRVCAGDVHLVCLEANDIIIHPPGWRRQRS